MATATCVASAARNGTCSSVKAGEPLAENASSSPHAAPSKTTGTRRQDPLPSASRTAASTAGISGVPSTVREVSRRFSSSRTCGKSSSSQSSAAGQRSSPAASSPTLISVRRRSSAGSQRLMETDAAPRMRRDSSATTSSTSSSRWAAATAEETRISALSSSSIRPPAGMGVRGADGPAAS